MKGNPRIISVGDARARRETPRRFWGAIDWQREAEAERRRWKPAPDQVVIPPPASGLPQNFGGLRGNDRPEERRDASRSAAVDRALKQIGIRR